MSKRTRQCIGILFAIVAYYIIHEGAHLVMALMFHAFKKINFMWLGKDGIVEAETDVNNIASQQVLMRAGFIKNGKIGEEGPRFVYGGKRK